MTEQQGVSEEAFRFMVERAGLELNAEDMASLKQMYELFADQVASLHELDLGAEDLAVSYWPQWDTPRQGEGE